MKKLFGALLFGLAMLATAVMAGEVRCRPDGHGGFICTPYPQCMPGTMC